MPDMLTAALGFAAAGWPVHPCHPGRKTPMTRWRDAATTDPATITRWWRQCPSANIGMATGHPGPDVVDVDTAHGKPGRATLDRLRAAGLVTGSVATVRTPSGGLHLFFAGTDQGNGSLARHGLDFRGRGGYVVAPPSIVDGNPYRVIAHRPATGVTVDWQAIRRHLDPPQPAPRPRPGGRSDHAALIRWMAGRPAGSRNEGLFWAARRAVETGADQQVFAALVAAAVAAGLPEPEAERTVRSARRAEVPA